MPLMSLWKDQNLNASICNRIINLVKRCICNGLLLSKQCNIMSVHDNLVKIAQKQYSDVYLLAGLLLFCLSGLSAALLSVGIAISVIVFTTTYKNGLAQSIW